MIKIEDVRYLCDQINLTKAVVEVKDNLCVISAEAAGVKRLLHFESDGRHRMASHD